MSFILGITIGITSITIGITSNNINSIVRKVGFGFIRLIIALPLLMGNEHESLVFGHSSQGQAY